MIIADIVRVTARETHTITSRKLGRGHEEVAAAAGFGLGLQVEMLFFLVIIVFDSTVLSSQTGFASPQQYGVLCLE